MAITREDPDFVTALARGLTVITTFGLGFEQLTLSDVAARAGLTRGTARRFLLTLEALGYVRWDGKAFRLSPKALDLGYAYLSSQPLWKAAQPIMQGVVDELEESSSLGVLDGLDVVYIARVLPKHFSFVPVTIGTRMPAHVNAMGQVLLAELGAAELDDYFSRASFTSFTRHTLVDQQAIRRRIARVARDGYALSDQQIQLGMRSIAVPVRSKSKRAEVALNASAGESRASKDDLLTRFRPVLQQAAEQLAHAL
jgi:IclR family transcriptional regulator, pca regulon regulatory protein